MEETKGRIKEYKNVGKDPEECRRRRQETTVQLRKVSFRIIFPIFRLTFFKFLKILFFRPKKRTPFSKNEI